jgi:hypothetical protein
MYLCTRFYQNAMDTNKFSVEWLQAMAKKRAAITKNQDIVYKDGNNREHNA